MLVGKLEDDSVGLTLARAWGSRLGAHRLGGSIATFFGALAGYVAFARLGYQLVGDAGGMALFWPPNGWVVALVVLSPRARRYWVVAAVVPGELIADSLQGTPALTALGWGTTNVLEASLAAWLFLTIARRNPLGDTVRDVMALTVAAVTAPLVGGLFGAGVSKATYGGAYSDAWLNWWVCDATGILLVVPLVLSFARPASTSGRRRRLEGLVAIALVVGSAVGLFAFTSTPLEFLILPPLVLLAVTSPLRVMSSASILVAITAAICTGRGLGPFAAYAAEPRVLSLQAFIATSAAVVFFISATMAERRRAEAALAEIAMRDPLTGLANRRLFMHRLDEVAARRDRSSESAAVVYLDLNRFKETNDRFGHAAGDAVLTETGRRLASAVRDGDIAARIGGDEFAALLEPVDGLEGAELFARRIARAIEYPFEFGEVSLSLGVSVGVSLVGRDGDLSLRQADQRQYRDKYKSRTGPMRALSA